MAENFQYGEQASQAKMMRLLNGLRSQGTSVLSILGTAIDQTITSFNRKLQAMNGRVQRANRSKAPTTPVLFVTSDFLDINQGLTTAAIRADVRSAHLKERTVPATAVVKQLRFTPNIGTVEQLDAAGTQFRVHTDNDGGQIPTGVFDIQLTESEQLTFLVFDTIPTPSDPAIKVEVSNDNVTFVAAQSTSFDADRITAWLAPQPVRYVRLTIVPTHPDELSGTTFTFGVLDFTGSGTDYQLQSELITKPITFSPHSNSLQFVADKLQGVSYFLSIGPAGTPGPYVEVNPGDIITIPGSAAVAPVSVGFVGIPWSDPGNTGTTVASTLLAVGTYIRPTVPNGFIYQVTISGTAGAAEPTWPLVAGNTVVTGGATLVTIVDGILNHVLATNYYPQTLSVIGDDTHTNITPGIGLSFTDPNLVNLTRRYIAIAGTQLRLVSNSSSVDVGKTFTLSYQTGPAQVQVSLKVRLSSTNRSVTPVFTGASLQQS